MKKTIVLLAAILVTSMACKKSTTSTTPGGGGTVQQNTGMSNGFPASGTGSINGVLYAQRISVPTYSVTSYNAGAVFSKTAKAFSSLYVILGVPVGYDPAGAVEIDSTTLSFNATNVNNHINSYTDSAGTSVYNSAKWTVGGNSNFSTLTTTVTRGYPAIAQSNYLPSAFSKSQPLTINLGTNYSNTDSLIVMVTDNASTNPFFVYKYLPGNASSVTFTAAQLSGASTSSSAPEIIVYAKNYSNLSTGGKNYIFVMENDLVQFVTITP